jgi:hypothetical protein
MFLERTPLGVRSSVENVIAKINPPLAGVRACGMVVLFNNNFNNKKEGYKEGLPCIIIL